MEQEVLSGFDLKNYIPWIVVIEAIIPGLPAPSFEKWATGADDAGVHDGVFRRSRPLLSRKEMGNLRHAFTLPPNICDDFAPQSKSFSKSGSPRLKQRSTDWGAAPISAAQ